jgi:hypothetical protein
MTNGTEEPQHPREERSVGLESVMRAFERVGSIVAEESKRVEVEGRLDVRYRLNVRGDILVSGDISLVNADCAEEFDILPQHLVEPGTVMVLNENGNLEPSCQAYDKKVAGVISGAGDYKPGLVLDKKQQQHQSEEEGKERIPIALMGKVYCKVDASLSPIEVGDLLTTSSIKGHAMKADDPIKAFGTVIGKALKPLKQGKGLIPVLVALQ